MPRSWSGCATRNTAPRCCRSNGRPISKIPPIEVTTQVQTQNRAAFAGKPATVAPLSDAERKLNLAGTELIPTDGLVKETADEIVRGKKDDIDKARAHLRMGGRQHLPRSQDTGLRRRRRRRDDQDRQPQRQVRRPQRALSSAWRARPACRRATSTASGSRPRSSASRRWAPDRQRHQGAALPRRSVARRQRLDAGRSRRRAQGRARGAAGQSRHRPTRRSLAARKALFGAWEGNWVAFNVAARREAAGHRASRRSRS